MTAVRVFTHPHGVWGIVGCSRRYTGQARRHCSLAGFLGGYSA